MRVTSAKGKFYTSVRVYYTYQCTWYYWYQVSLGTRNDDAWGMYVSCKL